MICKINVILVAAGSGSRFKSELPKQYQLLAGKEIIFYSIDLFLKIKTIDKLIIVIRKIDEDFFIQQILSKYSFQERDRINYCFGGDERSQSVLNGLNSLEDSSCDYVLIHDAARPMIDEGLIDNLINKIVNKQIDAVFPALKITEAIKSIENNIIKSIDRTYLYLAQTPQIFNYQKLKNCFNNEVVHLNFHDEIELLERHHAKIAIIEGDRKNIKITTSEDLSYLEIRYL